MGRPGRVTLTVAVITLVLGCGENKPTGLERLAVGSEALTFYDKTYGVPGNDDPNVVRVHGLSARRRNDIDVDEIPVGTKVRVVEDAGPEEKKEEREVQVIVLEGEGVLIQRQRLRPVGK